MSEYERALRERDELVAKGKLYPNLDELMWRAIRAHLGVTNFAQVPWGQCWQAARELGFPLAPHQEEAADRWRGMHPAPIREPSA